MSSIARVLFAVESVHRALQPRRAERKDGLGGRSDSPGQRRPLVGRPFAEHVVYLKAFGKVAPDTEAKPRIVAVAEQLGDAFEPVVSAVAAFGPDADRAERQRDVVDDDQQVLLRDLFGFQPVADRLAAQVHVGRRLQQHERPSLVPELGDRAVAARCKDGARLGCQCVGHFESYVMPGFGVLGADIAQPDDQVFQFRSCLR